MLNNEVTRRGRQSLNYFTKKLDKSQSNLKFWKRRQGYFRSLPLSLSLTTLEGRNWNSAVIKNFIHFVMRFNDNLLDARLLSAITCTNEILNSRANESFIMRYLCFTCSLFYPRHSNPRCRLVGVAFRRFPSGLNCFTKLNSHPLANPDRI